MNIKPYDKSIKDLLISGRQFKIPRFQRDYSWDRKNYQEFLEDMLGCLVISENKIVPDSYFLGTMLFVGDFVEGSDKEILVVDGQQRITTITILFSALSDHFISIDENTLSEQIFRYIMTKNDDGEIVRILKSDSHYPFFSYFIQDREKKEKQGTSSEEEESIEKTYKFFYEQLKEKKVRSILKKKFGSEDVDSIKYVDILKALRDQVLQTTFVSISTKDKNQANKIFEILNAKGKRLADIDMIKNKIFEVLDKIEPADFADIKWNKIKTILNTGNETIGLATFYRHFWISNYRKSASTKLYDDFQKYVKPKNKETYKAYLELMEENAVEYMKILNPSREDYQNRKEYFGLVQSLRILSDFFNIVQVRIGLLPLLILKKKDLISLKELKKIILYLENFHFAYNAIMSGSANRFEKIYSDFAIHVRKCSDKNEVTEVIKDRLIKPLGDLFPSYDEFETRFKDLSYSKKANSSNIKTKYAINKLNCFFSKTELFPDDGSIEHIIPENGNEKALNIGNLIMLEQPLNSKADGKCYEDKIVIYNRSKLAWVDIFIKENEKWNEGLFSNRAENMAKVFYREIFKRQLPEESID